MTKQSQIQVPPELEPAVGLAVSILTADVTQQIGQLTKVLEVRTGTKQSTLELEIYTQALCSCLFGIVCEHQDNQIPLKQGQAHSLQEKLKQVVIDLFVNELQDQQPQPSQN